MICPKVNPTNGWLLIAGNTNGQTERRLGSPCRRSIYLV